MTIPREDRLRMNEWAAENGYTWNNEERAFDPPPGSGKLPLTYRALAESLWPERYFERGDELGR